MKIHTVLPSQYRKRIKHWKTQMLTPYTRIRKHTSTHDMLIWHKEIVYVTLCPLMSWCEWSFWNTLPPSKSSRTFSGGSQGNCTPSSETLVSPTTQGVMLSTHPESSLQMGKSHPPRGSGFTCVFLLGDFYLLDVKVEVYCALFIIKQKFVEVNPEWPVGLDLPQVTGCNVCGSPLPWKLTAKFPLEIVVLVFLSSSLLRHEFPISCANQRHNQNWLNKRGFIKYSKSEVRMKEAIETFLSKLELWCQMQDLESNSCLADPLSLLQE